MRYDCERRDATTLDGARSDRAKHPMVRAFGTRVRDGIRSKSVIGRNSVLKSGQNIEVRGCDKCV